MLNTSRIVTQPTHKTCSVCWHDHLDYLSMESCVSCGCAGVLDLAPERWVIIRTGDSAGPEDLGVVHIPVIHDVERWMGLGELMICGKTINWSQGASMHWRELHSYAKSLGKIACESCFVGELT